MDVAGDEQLPPAGWYPDQGQVGLLRHWTGTAWADEWCPLPDPAPQTVVAHPGSAPRDPFHDPASVPTTDGPVVRAISKVIAAVVAVMGLGQLLTGLLLLRTVDGGVSGWAVIDCAIGLTLAVIGIMGLVRPSWVTIRPLRPGERIDSTPRWIQMLSPAQSRALRIAVVVCVCGVLVWMVRANLGR